MYGIHPKNMTRCSNGLKLLTALLIAIYMEFTEEYDKVLKWSHNTHNSTHSYMYGIHRRIWRGAQMVSKYSQLTSYLHVWNSPKNITRYSNGLNILTTLPIAICMEFNEEYDKVLKWSQNTHNSTHSYMYGIHRRIWQGAQMVSKYSQLFSKLYVWNSPKNMSRCLNGLKILTTLLLAICTEFTEEYDKVLKWSQNTYNSTHTYMYEIHRRTWQGAQMVSKYSQLYS